MFNILNYEVFPPRKAIYNLTQFLLPLLRLIRLADSDQSYTGKIYPKLRNLVDGIRQQLDKIPDGEGIIALVEEHADIMIHDLH